MDKLPLEILHKIFIQLVLRDRLVCTLVCRKWQSVLEKYSLFYSIQIYEDADNFNSVLNMFEHSPDRAAQVMELTIKFKSERRFNRRMIPTLFANVRKIVLLPGFGDSDRNPSYFGQHVDMTGLTSKTEFLADFRDFELLSQIISSNLGDKLKKLVLNCYKTPSISSIFSQMKNLPVLEKLYLDFPTITINDLEIIHQNIPSIKDFSIFNIQFNGGDMPSDVVPAISLASLRFGSEHYDNVDTHAQVYQYMAKKYINLTDVDYADGALFGYRRDKSKIVYENGLVDFLKLIASFSTTLPLDGMPGGVNVFDSLDSVDSKVDHLILRGCRGNKMLKYLVQSNQAKSIKTLDIINSNPESIRFLQNMPVLTTLTISLHRNCYELGRLNDCLKACPPTLKHLGIKSADLDILKFNKQMPSIEGFAIDTDILPRKLGDIISSCFPNLIDLKIKGVVKEDIRIHLQNPHFEKGIFTISKADLLCDTFPSFSFKCPGQSKYYERCNDMVGYEEEFTNIPAPYERIGKPPMLSVECSTEKRLVLGGSFKVLALERNKNQ